MLLWSLSWRSLNWGGTTPINTGRPGRSSPHTPPSASSKSFPAFNLARLFHQDSRHSLTMKGHFSIEWMAQSSQPAHNENAPEPAACGTHSESLPGFYCRQQKFEEPGGLDVFSQQQTFQSNQGKRSPSNRKPPKPFHKSWRKKNNLSVDCKKLFGDYFILRTTEINMCICNWFLTKTSNVLFWIFFCMYHLRLTTVSLPHCVVPPSYLWTWA